jgi:hypothetical protein
MAVRPNRFQLIALLFGAGLIIDVELWTLLRIVRERPDELGDEVVPLVVSLILFSPYVGLATGGRRVRPAIGYAALASLLATTALFFVAAASDASRARHPTRSTRR